jgi:hypothetical protein
MTRTWSGFRKYVPCPS